jgi:hypothetical protein
MSRDPTLTMADIEAATPSIRYHTKESFHLGQWMPRSALIPPITGIYIFISIYMHIYVYKYIY